MAHYLEEELQNRLREDDRIWDFLRHSCLDGMWFWDLENPQHEWMSPEFWHLFGYDPKDMPHSPESWFDIIHPEDKALAVENFEKHLADPTHAYDQIVRYRHKEGHTIWVRCRGLAIRDETGRGLRMLGAHTDMTEFVRAAEAREQTSARLAARLGAVFDATQGGIIGLDAERRVITLNSPARALLGGNAETGGFSWPDAIRFLDGSDMKPLDASADPINRALSGAHLNGEVHLMTRDDGSSDARYVRISSARVAGDDTDVHTVIAIDDVSEQEKNRQQIERQGRLDALGQLTGGIAHDFNNLLSTILYAVTLVQKEATSPRAQDLLDQSLKTITRGRDLTGRLLAFAKNHGDAPARHKISSVFQDFGRLVRPTIEEQITILFSSASADLEVYCDLHMLENALLNITLNSRDAIMQSGVGDRIELSAHPVAGLGMIEDLEGAEFGKGVPDDQNYIRISVTDNGPGMEQEVRRRATDPFFTTKTANSGTGLGLSMVFGFVRQAGGNLQISSAPGQGTIVSLYIPAGPAFAPAPPRAGHTPKDEGQGQGQGETVMIVEDEKTLLRMMAEQLEQLGYEVFSISTGALALELIEEGLEFDLLLSDVVMPGGVGGFELVRKVQEIRPGTPAILLSGYAGYSLEDRSTVNAEFLQKPCPPDVLDMTLRKLLDNA